MGRPCTITATDVARAAAEAQRLKLAWERFDCRTVSEAEIEDARHTACQADAAVRALRPEDDRWTRVELRIARTLKAILGDAALITFGWLPCALLLATPAPALVALLLALGGVRLALVLIVALWACLLAAGSLALLLYPFRRADDLVRQVECLERRLSLREGRLRELQTAHENWRGNYCRLLNAQAAGHAYEDAWKRHQEMIAKF
jgi:hypothetical protein